MNLPFVKMQGCGNDYIYIDCLEHPERIPKDPGMLSVRLSDRHFGIGGDGIIFILPSAQAHAKMRIFNADGSEGKMCGNGIRCVGKFLYDNGYVRSEDMLVETLSGIKKLKVLTQGQTAGSVTVKMGKADFGPFHIPVCLSQDAVIDYPLEIEGHRYQITCVSMGNPHCVIFGGNPALIPLEQVGPLFEHHTAFPEGINTEFAEVIDSHTLRMRVWERGSGETYACGTGACAVVAAAVKNGFCKEGETVTVRLRGGDLLIRYTEENLDMTGPAVLSFYGETIIE